jgi:ATP-dependent Clp protease ATP-binding subunit ClpA
MSNSAAESWKDIARTEGADAALIEAGEWAIQEGAVELGPKHLLIALLSGRDAEGNIRPASAAAECLRVVGVANTEDIANAMIAELGSGQFDEMESPLLGAALADVLSRALAHARADAPNKPIIDTPHLLMGLLEVSTRAIPALRRLRDAEVNPGLIRDAYHMLRAGGPAPHDAGLEAASAVAALTIDLTAQAKAGLLDPVIGRDAELERMITILSRRRKNSPVLIGEPGVGKTALVGGLAQRIADGRVPARMLGRRILQFTPARLVAGTVYRGQFEDKVNRFLDELRADHEAILFIDELHTIVGAGAGGANETNDLANLLKPALASGELATIGATTRAEYRRYIETDEALERRFAPVEIEEPNQADTRKILAGLVSRYAAHHGVEYPSAVLDACVSLAASGLPARHFPDKAIDLMDEAGAEASKAGRAQVSLADVRAGLPAAAGSRRVGGVGRDLAARLAVKVIGQRAATDQVAEVLTARALALTERAAPLATFVLCGPMATGKASLASAIADELFDGAITVIDLAEFGEPHTVSGLIGSPPGYVGYEQRSRLVEPLRHTPGQVVLLKHIDLAHSAVRAIIADVLRTGRLADTTERAASFRGAVMVMTLTTEAATRGELGFRKGSTSPEDGEAARLRERLSNLLGPAFLDLIDEPIGFAALDSATLSAIAEARIASLAEGLARRGVRLAVTSAVRERIVAGARARGGARDLGRLVERMVERPAAAALAAEQGARTLDVDVEADRIVARTSRRRVARAKSKVTAPR